MIRTCEEAISYKKQLFHKECFKKEILIPKINNLTSDLESNKIDSKQAIIVLMNTIVEFVDKEL